MARIRKLLDRLFRKPPRMSSLEAKLLAHGLGRTRMGERA